MRNAKKYIKDLCLEARKGAGKLALLDTRAKNRILDAMARNLLKDADHILKENAGDVKTAREKGLAGAVIDRIILNENRIRSMAGSIREVARLKDPVGDVMEARRRPNGLVIKKVRVPIGVILMIYEARPNVTSDCASLCLKSGNSVILRGGSDSLRSNKAIYRALNRAMPVSLRGAINLVTEADRKIVRLLLAESKYIDLVMPRGGESLIRDVARISKIPVIKHYKGVCHTYVDKRCDMEMAQHICLNAKVQRPGVCNAMETLLVHKDIANRFLPEIAGSLKAAGVEIRGCGRTRGILKDRDVKPAKETDWYTEYLDLILSVRVVKDIDEAIAHIAKYGSQHSDAIVTRDSLSAARFLKEVDSACVYVNASTRFTDGYEFGKGAEIGISTDRLHARGPMGLEELTTYKYAVTGNGQIRL